MTVSTFVQPNYNTQSGTAYPLNIDAAFAALLRLAGAFAPHEQAAPNMTVRLDAGHIFNGTTLAEVAAQSTAAITAPAANPRKDIVYVDRSTGAVGVAAGAEAASPVDPAIPAGKVPVARVNLATSTTVIANSIIDDIRNLSLLGLASGAVTTVGTAATRNAAAGSGDLLPANGDGSGLTGIVSVPTGAVMPYAGAAEPAGWKYCAGQAISRTTFSALFAVIGTTFGAGDGSTTFNLPDLRGRAAFGRDDMNTADANRVTTGGSGIDGNALGASGGAETVALTVAQLAAHTHAVRTGSSSGGPQGVAYAAEQGVTYDAAGAALSTGSGSPHQNMPPALILNYIIKT
jgi:microcystin-dependent protein